MVGIISAGACGIPALGDAIVVFFWIVLEQGRFQSPPNGR